MTTPATWLPAGLTNNGLGVCGPPRNWGRTSPMVPFADWGLNAESSVGSEPLPRPALCRCAGWDAQWPGDDLGVALEYPQDPAGAGPQAPIQPMAPPAIQPEPAQLPGEWVHHLNPADRRRNSDACEGVGRSPLPAHTVTGERHRTVNSPAAEYFEASNLCAHSGMECRGPRPAADYASRIAPRGLQHCPFLLLANWKLTEILGGDPRHNGPWGLPTSATSPEPRPRHRQSEPRVQARSFTPAMKINWL